MATYRSWAQSGVTQRANSTAYSLGARMQPLISDTSANHAVAKRYVWECTTAGTSGASVPAWSTSYTPDSSTITDGTVTWTCRNPGYSSGSTVDWTFASIFVAYTATLLATDDTLLVHYTSQEAASSTAYSIRPTANCRIVSVDKDASEVYTPMGTNGWLMNTSNTTTDLSPVSAVLRADGLTLRSTSTSTAQLNIAGVDEGQVIARDLRLELANNANPRINLGGREDARSRVDITGLTVSFGNSAQLIRLGGFGSISGMTIVTAAPSILFQLPAANDASGAHWVIQGDLSGASSSATLVADSTTGITPGHVEFHGCILPSSYTILSGAANVNESGLEVLLVNCKAGATEGIHAYANALGSVIRNTTIKHGSQAFSWKIDSASSSRNAPFRLPWMWGQIETGASVTPTIQLARDGSSTAFTDAQVWLESGAQVTASSPTKTFATTEPAYSSAGSNLGSGSGSWTGLGGTNWTGQIAAAAITPTGDEFQARLCVATTDTVYAAQGWET